MLSACATATHYQPNFTVQPGQAASRGFSEQRIEGKPWKATGSSRARLTVAQGYDSFAIAVRQTDRQTSTYVQSDPFYNSWYGFNFGHFAPSWRYDGASHRWNSWGPANGQPLLRQ